MYERFALRADGGDRMALYVQTLIVFDSASTADEFNKDGEGSFRDAYAIGYGQQFLGIRAFNIDDRYTGTRNEAYDAELQTVLRRR
jgi:hypothetical protein